MQIQTAIEQKLANEINDLDHLDVINESHNHNVPANSETHFKVVMVSEAFAALNSVKRHQWVYKILADELATGVHALAIHTFTPVEWREKHGDVPLSPPCLGGE